MWVISYQENWGTRFPRVFRNFYTSRKPTQQEAIDVLNKHKIAAMPSWFAPHNSGLISIRKIKTEF